MTASAGSHYLRLRDYVLFLHRLEQEKCVLGEDVVEIYSRLLSRELVPHVEDKHRKEQFLVSSLRRQCSTFFLTASFLSLVRRSRWS